MKKANISKYNVFSSVIVFIILLSISYTQIDAYKGSASTAQNKCGRYQIIVYDVEKDIVNDILNNRLFDEAEVFVQTYTNSDNGIINSIHTTPSYFALSMNKILAVKFPESENEAMVDENDACKFGKTFLDSVQKKIVINDEFSNLCGFSFLDLAAQKQHYNKIEESLICQTLMLVVVLCLFLLSLFLSTTYTNNVKNKIRKLVIADAITATVYFLANIIINYLLYNYSIKINIFYEYAVPIIEILVTSLCLISFLNIKILRH